MIPLYGVAVLNLYVAALAFTMFVGGFGWGLVEIYRDKRLIETLTREGMPDRKVARAMLNLRRPYRYIVPQLMELSFYWLMWHSIWPLPVAPAEFRDDLAVHRLTVDVFVPVAAVLVMLVHIWVSRRSRKIIQEKQS